MKTQLYVILWKPKKGKNWKLGFESEIYNRGRFKAVKRFLPLVASHS